MREEVGGDDAANGDFLWRDRENVCAAGMFGCAVGDCDVHREAAQQHVAVLVARAERFEAEDAEESVFSSFLVLGFDTDVINAGRRVAIDNRLGAAASE